MMTTNHIKRTLFLIAMGVLVSFGAGASAEDRINFDAFLWKNRPLLLFAPSPDAPEYKTLKTELKAQADQIIDRDMVLIEIFDTGLVRMDGKPWSAESDEKLRRQFSVSSGNLTAILIGKDGGQKLRQSNQVDLGSIFALIDTMPMRQQEMRDK